MRRYNGLCIGGPYDGHMRSSESPSIVVAEQPSVDFVRQHVEPWALDISVTEYRYERLRGARTTIGLFVHESMDIDEALAALIDCYVSHG
ncbi:MAG: hypothetical protein GWN58_16430 [Anaerolineae bacterium]|nr:hypothetical protein [Anaerolineae bacterium]